MEECIAWVCRNGHVCKFPRECGYIISNARIGTHWVPSSCGAPTRPLTDFPGLYTAWVLGGLDGFIALWNSPQRPEWTWE